MPGLAGFFRAGQPDENAKTLARMVDVMRHEPFYSSGTHADAKLGLWAGWVSLKGSFSDCMPVWNEKRDVCLIFSGEDYRDRGDIEALKQRGHAFEEGNASYLVHYYEEAGLDFIEKLNGRFNGILIDLSAQRVFLFNDRFGLNRVYFHESREGFYFSSEAKSLLKVRPELRRLDTVSLAENFSLGCVLQNRTLYQGIDLLPGGSLWEYRPGRRVRRAFYFRPAAWETQESLGKEEFYSHLRKTWSRILPRYVRGNDGVALSLTGGKDTRMILAWLRFPPGVMPCYTYGGMYRECADVRLARRIAEICRQDHHVIRLDRTFLKEFPDLAEKTAYVTDGIKDASGTADLFLSRIAREVAPIRLTGNYGQEILYDYVAFKPMRWDSRILGRDFLPLTERAARTYADELADHRPTFAAFKQAPWHHGVQFSVELTQLEFRSPYFDNDLVALAFRGSRDPATCIELQLRLIKEGSPDLARIETDFGLLYRPLPVLTWIKRRSREISHKAEYAYDYGMPDWLVRIDHILTPLHLERLFLGRHKISHFRTWYRNELSRYIKDVLIDPRSLARDYVNGPQLEQAVSAHVNGARNYTLEIHRLLAAELMQRQLID
jgi:asparagine synthase (glutamine-hydrolysing)